jgi:hypothetical protein
MCGLRHGVMLALSLGLLAGCAGANRRFSYAPTGAKGPLPPGRVESDPVAGSAAGAGPIDPFVTEHNGRDPNGNSRIGRFFPMLARRGVLARQESPAGPRPAPADDSFLAGARVAASGLRDRSSARNEPLASVPARRASARRRPSTPAPMLPVAVTVRAFPEDRASLAGEAPQPDPSQRSGRQPAPPAGNPVAAAPAPAVPRDAETRQVQAELSPDAGTPYEPTPVDDLVGCDPDQVVSPPNVPLAEPPPAEPAVPETAPIDPREPAAPAPAVVEPPAEPADGPPPIVSEEPGSREEPAGQPEESAVLVPPEPETSPDAPTPPEGPAPAPEASSAAVPDPIVPTPAEASAADPDTNGDPALLGRPRLPISGRASLPTDLPAPEYPRAYYPDRTPPSERSATSTRPPRRSIVSRLRNRIRSLRGADGPAHDDPAR